MVDELRGQLRGQDTAAEVTWTVTDADGADLLTTRDWPAAADRIMEHARTKSLLTTRSRL